MLVAEGESNLNSSHKWKQWMRGRATMQGRVEEHHKGDAGELSVFQGSGDS